MKDAAAQVYERLLILRCQAGDETALTELIARYSPGLRFFLRNLANQPASADDLLQETWLDAYRKINALRRPEAFTAWIYRIARDKAYRGLRGRPAATVSIDVECEDLAAVDEDDPFTPDDAARVRFALDGLPPEQREVLVLRFIEDMSYGQIADVTGQPVGTVRSRLHYAKRALRARLQPLTPERT